MYIKEIIATSQKINAEKLNQLRQQRDEAFREATLLNLNVLTLYHTVDVMRYIRTSLHTQPTDFADELHDLDHSITRLTYKVSGFHKNYQRLNDIVEKLESKDNQNDH